MAQAKAHLRNLRISPKKTRLVVDVVRGMSVDQARRQLALMNKRAARPILKLLESAAANAVNNHELEQDTLSIKEIMVDQGPTYKRWLPRAFGRATPIRKRTSHVTVVVQGEQAAKRTARKKAEDKAPTAKDEGKKSAPPPVTSKEPKDEPKPEGADLEKGEGSEIFDPRRVANRPKTAHTDTMRKKGEGGKKSRIFRRKSG